MLDVAQNVLPVFLMIFIGWLIVATKYLKPEAGIALSEFVFKLAVPVLIFRTLAQATSVRRPLPASPPLSPTPSSSACRWSSAPLATRGWWRSPS